jgi:hypothetical protein
MHALLHFQQSANFKLDVLQILAGSCINMEMLFLIDNTVPSQVTIRKLSAQNLFYWFSSCTGQLNRQQVKWTVLYFKKEFYSAKIINV